MVLAPIGLVLVLTLLGVIAFSLTGRNRANMSDSIALAIIGVCVAILSYALIKQEGLAINDFLDRRSNTEIQSAPPNVKVWVDSQTGLYHCRGSKQYTRAGKGRYMTQQQARREYYKAASGTPCE